MIQKNRLLSNVNKKQKLDYNKILVFYYKIAIAYCSKNLPHSVITLTECEQKAKTWLLQNFGILKITIVNEEQNFEYYKILVK